MADEQATGLPEVKTEPLAAAVEAGHEEPTEAGQAEVKAESEAPPADDKEAVDYDTRIHELEAQVTELNKEIARLREEKKQRFGVQMESTTKSLVSVGDAAVFVSDIARGVEEDQLREGFNRLAPVLDVHIIRSKKTGLSKGFGFIKFNSMDDVYKVLDQPNEWPSYDDKVSHRRAQVRVQIADPKNVLYIVGLPRDMTYEQASTEVTQNGKVEFTKFDLASDGDGRSRGYGWITYLDHEQALIALRNLQNSVIRGIPMREKVTMAEPRVVDHRAILRSKALFVKGLQRHVTHEMVEKLFNQGKEPAVVEKVTIPQDQIKHVPLGHAFVHFRTREDAQAAMDTFSNYDFEGRRLHIEWCIPQDAKRDSRKRPFDDRGPPGRFGGGDRGYRDDRGYGDRYGGGGDRYSGGDRYTDRYRDDRYRDERPPRRPRYDYDSGFSDGPRGPPRRDDYYDQGPSQQQQQPAQYGGGMGGQDFQQAFSANVGTARDALFSLASSLSRANGGAFGASAAQPAANAYSGYGQSAYSQGYAGSAAATAPYAQTSGYAQPPQQQYGAATGFGTAGAAQAQYGATSAAAAAPQYGTAQYAAAPTAQRPAAPASYNPYAR